MDDFISVDEDLEQTSYSGFVYSVLFKTDIATQVENISDEGLLVTNREFTPLPSN